MQIGEYNTLQVSNRADAGFYMTDENGDKVLLPNKWIPENLQENDELEVFIYLDNEQRPIATTMTPKATVGEFATLKVRQMTKLGAFLDWGVEKDLFVPFKEQQEKMEAGHSYPVFIYLDEKSGRIVGSSKVDKFAQLADEDLKEGQEVELLLSYRTDLGYKVVINNYYGGLLYHSDIHKPLNTGDQTAGYIKTIREDGKIDVLLDKPGYGNIEPNAQSVLEALEREEGFLALHDKSDPKQIKSELGMSKKVFKKAIGSLYKQKRIALEPDGIRLLKS